MKIAFFSSCSYQRQRERERERERKTSKEKKEKMSDGLVVGCVCGDLIMTNGSATDP